MLKFVLWIIIIASIFTSPALALGDPRVVPNNKVGVNILSPEADAGVAASMINAGGDWGYLVLVIKKSERDLPRWQSLFHSLSRLHLIPIVRLATEVDSQGNWQKPSDEDAQSWADFLAKLYWPVKNRYVQVYNEVNRASEWGGKVDAAEYTIELNKTIDALKARNENFFVLNAPLDLALGTSNESLEAVTFLNTMRSVSPAIFTKLDGWASHSYPNPGFSAGPYKSGRTGINGFKWELSQISPDLNDRDLPIFITETGWRRSTILEEDQIAEYYKIAFEEIWNDENVVAVCPFVFNYQDPLYKAFSFKNHESPEGDFYNYFYVIQDLIKVKGEPERENIAGNFQINIPEVLVNGFSDTVTLSIQNNGNYIWNKDKLRVEVLGDVETTEVNWDKNEVYPGQGVGAVFRLKTDKIGPVNLRFKISGEDKILAERELNTRSETLISLILGSLLSFIQAG